MTEGNRLNNMNDNDALQVLKHLVMNIPLDKNNLAELRAKAPTYFYIVESGLAERDEIKARAEAHIAEFELAIELRKKDLEEHRANGEPNECYRDRIFIREFENRVADIKRIMSGGK